MYGLLIFFGILALIVAYFCFGIVVKFLWGWFPVIFGTIVTVAMLLVGDWIWQVVGVLLFFMSIYWTNQWHSCAVYTAIEEKLDKLFNFAD